MNVKTVIMETPLSQYHGWPTDLISDYTEEILNKVNLKEVTYVYIPEDWCGLLGFSDRFVIKNLSQNYFVGYMKDYENIKIYKYKK